VQVLIVGAGLAGLSAAVAMSVAGADVMVIDQSEKRATGASIGITGRAVDALAELNVLESAKPLASVLPVPFLGRQFDRSGDPIPGSSDVHRAPRPDGLPAAVVIHRADLAGLLLDRAAQVGADVVRPLQIRGLDQNAEGVAVTFADGRQDRFDLVVGADGVRSQVRSMIIPEVLPAYTGQMGLRVLIADIEPGQAGFYQIPEEGLYVAVSLLPGGLTYLATGLAMDSRRVEQSEARDMVRGILERFEAPYLKALGRRIDDDQEVIVGPYESLLIDGAWFRGRVLLIGDAAHTTTPNLSSGGGLALEDGVVLGQEFSTASSIQEALGAFMRRRRERTEFVVRTSLELMALSRNGDSLGEASALRSRAMQTLARPY
jgi:2-polyprenyl-6-methoxyphenol hydroxylase-like FAD-dependent oxidoreductase